MNLETRIEKLEQQAAAQQRQLHPPRVGLIVGDHATDEEINAEWEQPNTIAVFQIVPVEAFDGRPKDVAP